MLWRAIRAKDASTGAALLPVVQLQFESDCDPLSGRARGYFLMSRKTQVSQTTFTSLAPACRIGFDKVGFCCVARTPLSAAS